MPFRIITISRQYGSGGRTIGHRLAELLQIDYYDKALISSIAEQSGYAPSYIEEQCDYGCVSALDYIPMMHDAHSVSVPISPLACSQYVQYCLNDWILSIAEEKPCVIMGRGADYILRKRNDVLKVFLHADLEYRIQEVIRRKEALDYDQALALIEQFDKAKQRNYRQKNNRLWGYAPNYHLSLDVSALSPDVCVQFIAEAYTNYSK